MSRFFTSGGPSIGISASASVLPMNTQDWFPLGLTGLISLKSKGLSRVFSNTTVQKQRHYFTNKGPPSQGYGFSSGHVWMWELDYKESWALKNGCFWTVMLERTLFRVPWTAKRSNQSILKEISPGCSLEGLMLKLKFQYFGHLMWRSDSLEMSHTAGKDWRQEEKGTTEDEMVGWHH